MAWGRPHKPARKEEEESDDIVQLVIGKSDTDGSPTVKAFGPLVAVEAIRKVIADRTMALAILRYLVSHVEPEQLLSDEVQFVLVGGFSGRHPARKEEAVFVMREVLGWAVEEKEGTITINREHPL